MTYEQLKVCQYIKMHLKLTRSSVRQTANEYLEQNGEASPILELELPKLNKPIKFATTKNKLSLEKLIIFGCFKASALYSESKDFLDNFDLDFVAFYTGEEILAISKEKAYRGLGGLFVMENEDDSFGIVIEPMKHFLKRRYPLVEEAV